METKKQLQELIRAAEEKVNLAQFELSAVRGRLTAIIEQERKTEEKTHSGTRVEEYKDGVESVFVIARGPYYERPKFFQMYVDGQPSWTKSQGAWGGRRFKTRGNAEKTLIEIRAAEKEARKK